MTLEKTMEYILPGGIMNVECPRASLINRFENGTMVISIGHLWVQFSMTVEGIWKIGHLDFTFGGHQEYISRPKSITKKKIPPTQHIPESLVNKWGVPPRLFHILQIADIAPRMSEIVFHSLVSGATPRESLNAIAHDKQQPVASPVVKTQTHPLQLQQQQQLQQHQQQLQHQQSATASPAAVLRQPNGFPPMSYQQQTYPTNTVTRK